MSRTPEIFEGRLCLSCFSSSSCLYLFQVNDMPQVIGLFCDPYVASTNLEGGHSAPWPNKS